MKWIKDVLSFPALLALALVISPDADGQQRKGDPWLIPAGYDVIANPVSADSVVIREGQLAYDRKCALCHGRTGRGDGPKGRMSKTFPGDFSGKEFQRLSDGEIFYQTKFGRGEMPACEKRCTDAEIWRMVHYIRTMWVDK